MESTENILPALKMNSLCVFPLKKVKKTIVFKKWRFVFATGYKSD